MSGTQSRTAFSTELRNPFLGALDSTSAARFSKLRMVRMRQGAKESAGLLMFRRRGGHFEVLLAHPGGPFWANKDEGAWTIPKGLLDGQQPLEAARREFEEETGVQPEGPFIPLGSITQKAGKVVHAWAWEGDADPADMRSNDVRTEWPKGSGKWITVPEVDRCEWLSGDEARRRINPAQGELIDRLIAVLAEKA